MRNAILSIFILLNSGASWAGIDASLGGGYRSLPTGGGVDAEIGYGQLIWGSEVDPLYGFLRIAAVADGVVDHFTHGGYVEIFPVSIFGLRGGRFATQSRLDYDDYNCDTYLCNGSRTEGFTEAVLYLGTGPVQFATEFRRSLWDDHTDGHTAQEEYLEPASGLNFDRGTGEEVQRLRLYLFYKLSEKWSLGYIQSGTEVHGGPTASELTTGDDFRKSALWAGLVQYVPQDEDWKGFTVRLGAGEFRSHLLNTDPTFLFSARWNIVSKLGY